MLRAEARTGLGSHDVRRTLIKEELRPLAPPCVACGSDASYDPTAPPLATGSAQSRSMAASAGTDGDIADIPSAWLEGNFHLKPVIDDEGEAVAASTGAAPLPPALSSVLRTYQALCTAAEEVDYDLLYEEGLRQVEERDGETGLATTWRTRRCPSVSLLFSPMTMTALAGSSEARGERPLLACGAAALHDLYTKPPSRLFATGRGATGRLSAALLASRPASQASIMSAATSSAITTTTTSKVKAPVSRSNDSRGSIGTLSSLSAEGTAVVRSYAAAFTEALRQVVQAQRHYASGVGGDPPRLGSTSGARLGKNDKEGNNSPAVHEWRTHMTAAVMLAICSSCHAWFERTLQQPRRLPPSEGVQQRAAGDADSIPRCCCPRCGHDVDAETGGDTPTTAAAWSGPRWVWPPSVSTADFDAVARDSTGTSTRAIDSAVVRCLQEPFAPAMATRQHSSSGTGGEPCGTNGVGFAEAGDGDEEEPFAALVRHSRASKLRARKEKRRDTMGTSAAEARTHQAPWSLASMTPLRPSAEWAPTTVSEGGSIARGCTETGMSGKTMTFPVAAPPSESPPLSELAVPPRENLLAQSLRGALSCLYFHELWANAMGEQLL
nr:unnamed protein product [Leishmania braziliensis]